MERCGLMSESNLSNQVKFFIAGSRSDTDLGGNCITVVPTFPTLKETQEETAKSWTNNSSRTYNSEKRCYEYSEPSVPIVAENKFSSLSIIDLECRGNGGRAYKVILPVEGNNLLFDLREGPLLDMINTLGIKPGGVIEGEFEFVMNKSQLNLVRVGSSIWNEAKRISEASKVSATAYKVGAVYSDKSRGYFWIYLGAMQTKLKDSSVKMHVALKVWWQLSEKLLNPPNLLKDSGVYLEIKKSFTFYETEYSIPEDSYGEVSSYLKSLVEEAQKAAEIIRSKYPKLLKPDAGCLYSELEFELSDEAAALGGRPTSYWYPDSSENDKWRKARHSWTKSRNAQESEARKEFGERLSLWRSWDSNLVTMIEASSPIKPGGKR